MSRIYTLTVLMACLTLLLVKSGGAHVHLCFDGTGPSTSVKFDDGVADPAHVNTAAVQHHDLDLDVGNDLFGKLPKFDGALLNLLFAAMLTLIALRGKPPLAGARASRSPTLFPPHLRPPLRGPPTLISR